MCRELGPSPEQIIAELARPSRLSFEAVQPADKVPVQTAAPLGYKPVPTGLIPGQRQSTEGSSPLATSYGEPGAVAADTSEPMPPTIKPSWPSPEKPATPGDDAAVQSPNDTMTRPIARHTVAETQAQSSDNRNKIIGSVAATSVVVCAGLSAMTTIYTPQATPRPASSAPSFGTNDAAITVGAKKITVHIPQAGVLSPATKPSTLQQYAAVPEVTVQEVASTIASAHGVKLEKVEGTQPVMQLVADSITADQQILDTLPDSANVKAGKIKAVLGYAAAGSMYGGSFIKTLPPSETKELLNGMVKPNRQSVTAVSRAVLAATQSEPGQQAYTPNQAKLLAELLAIADSETQSLAHEAQNPESADPIEQGVNRYYVPSVDDVASIFKQASRADIENELPIVLDELHKKGLDRDHRVLAYVLATVLVEDPWFRSSQKELGAGPSKAYWPWIGWSYVQLTWEHNYLTYGNKTHNDLVHHPELMNDPRVGAQVLAQFQADRLHLIKKAVNSGSLRNARKNFNGGTNGLGPLLRGYAAFVKILENRAVIDADLPTKNLQLQGSVAVSPNWVEPEHANNTDPVDDAGFTTNLRGVFDALHSEFGITSLGGVIAPGDKKMGHGSDSDHYNGHAGDVMLDPRKDLSNFDKQEQIANWLVQNAERLHIRYLIVNNRIFNMDDAFRGKGWRLYDADLTNPNSSKDYILGHYDHIHISVYNSAPPEPVTPTDAQTGKVFTPTR